MNRCDNCKKEWTDDQVREAQDLAERLESGCVVPSGECPECGALCYPIKEPTRIVVTVEGGLVQSIGGIPAGVVVEVHDYDVEGSDPNADGLDEDTDGHFYVCSEWTAEPIGLVSDACLAEHIADQEEITAQCEESEG